MTITLSLQNTKEYQSFLTEIKGRIHTARLKAALAANQELVRFYWEIGRMIIEKQQYADWGDKLVEALARDLKKSFPDAKGFSRANLHYMRKFALTYPTFEIVQALPGQLPWTHHIVLLERTKTDEARAWYTEKTLENSWSYRALMQQIAEKAYERQGKLAHKTTNFKEKLPAPQSRFAQEMLKDPYRFDFLTIGEDAHEREIQKGLLEHVNQFLLALGQGFAFCGSHYTFQLSNKTYEIDLLMYHTKLHCYVVIELKRGEFHPKDAGQLNFYLSAMDDLLKMPQDNPTIGLLLCEKKDRIVAEYALRDVNKPIGISEYALSKALPKDLQSELPSIKAIEAELNVRRKSNSEKHNS